MKIHVQNVNRPDLTNTSSAQVLSGAGWSDHDLVIWDETPGYIPLKTEGFTEWNRYVNTFGSSVFICKSI